MLGEFKRHRVIPYANLKYFHKYFHVRNSNLGTLGQKESMEVHRFFTLIHIFTTIREKWYMSGSIRKKLEHVCHDHNQDLHGCPDEPREVLTEKSVPAEVMYVFLVCSRLDKKISRWVAICDRWGSKEVDFQNE